MRDKSTDNFIQSCLHKTFGTAAQIKNIRPVGGGSINECYRLDMSGGVAFFCKLNSAHAFPGLFEKERNGLQLLAASNTIRVPEVYNVVSEENRQLLLMEWIEQGRRSETFWKRFAVRLAALHNTGGAYFGLSEHNFMGSLPQHNGAYDSWIEFFTERRLKPQVQLALENKQLTLQEASLFDRLYTRLPGVFPDSKPALIHGDLWSGNYLCDDQEQPVLIDPACYYGEPAADLAMTTMFGGFAPAFYNSYNSEKAFAENYKQQWEICNLYPLLIHLNLFGNTYLPAILQTIKHY